MLNTLREDQILFRAELEGKKLFLNLSQVFRKFMEILILTVRLKKQPKSLKNLEDNIKNPLKRKLSNNYLIGSRAPHIKNLIIQL